MDDPESADLMTEEPEDRLDGADLCIACLAELVDGGNQCPACAAPVEPTAAISPWERVLAEGFVFRRAIAQPANLAVVVGVCLVFGSFFIAGAGLLYGHQFQFPLDLYPVLLAWFNLIVGGAGIWQCVRNWVRR